MEAVTRSLILCALLLGQTAYAREVPFDEVLSNPARYNNQQVSVKGIAEVVGDDFELWRDERALRETNLKHQIEVVQDLGLPPYPGTNVSRYSPANLHWVKVTGTVNTAWHGRFGFDSFGLILEHVQILAGPRLKQFLDSAIWLKNDTPRRLKVDVQSKYGEEMSGVGPGGLYYTEIPLRSNARLDLTLEGKLFARLQFVPLLAQRYYDPDKRSYYGRITEGKVTLVPPSEAKSWRFDPTPWRD